MRPFVQIWRIRRRRVQYAFMPFCVIVGVSVGTCWTVLWKRGGEDGVEGVKGFISVPEARGSRLITESDSRIHAFRIAHC